MWYRDAARNAPAKTRCLITGGASGLGLSLARLLSSRSNPVILIDRDKDALERAAQALAGAEAPISAFHADVTDEKALVEITHSLDKSMRLDCLILCRPIRYSAM